MGLVAERARVGRIWWVGVGSLATAPFHTAGDYSTFDGTRKTVDRAISWDIPTLKALSFETGIAEQPAFAPADRHDAYDPEYAYGA